MRGSFTGCTFIPLFPEPWGEASRQRLSSCVNPQAPLPVVCVRPPTPGLAFITATGALSSVLDAWWRDQVPAGSLPVVLMTQEAELQTWVTGLDAVFLVGVAEEADLRLYERCPNVSATLARGGAMELTEYAMRLYGGGDWDCFVVHVPPLPTSASPPHGRLDPSPRGAPPPGVALPVAQRGPPPARDAWVPDPLQSLAGARPVISGARPGFPREPARQPDRRYWTAGSPPAEPA